MLDKRYFLSVLSVLVFYGCSVSTSSANLKSSFQKLPDWITSPNNGDETYIYGIGIEKDRESAVNSALVDMVSKLGVKIESTFQTNEKVQYDISRTIVTNQIKADIEKIKISNYKVVQTQRLGYSEYAVMVKSNKEELSKSLRKSLKREMKEIKLRLKSSKDKDTLSKYNEVKSILKESKSLNPMIMVVSALDKGFEDKAYFDFMQKIEDRFRYEENSLNFYVIGDKNSEVFIRKIKNYLINNKLNVVDKKRDESILIRIKTTYTINNDSVIDIAVLTLIIEVYDKYNLIGGNSIILKERYNGSIKSAFKNAAIHLQEDIKSQGIQEVVGINLNLD